MVMYNFNWISNCNFEEMWINHFWQIKHAEADYREDTMRSKQLKIQLRQSFLDIENVYPKHGKLFQPTNQAINQSTNPPTHEPTNQPASQPTNQPTNQPINQPTNQPTNQPNNQPNNKRTNGPTKQASNQPTKLPTYLPTNQPTNQPRESQLIETRSKFLWVLTKEGWSPLLFCKTYLMLYYLYMYINYKYFI